MKICVIGDVHGSQKWRDIINKERDRVDRFIFLGDYFDSKEGSIISPEDQISNFNNIRECARLYGNIELLIGNHDLQYLGGTPSGDFSIELLLLTTDTIMEMIETRELQLCAKYDNYLFSHAGVSQVWMSEHNLSDLSELNQFFHLHPLELDFVGREGCSNDGNNIYQSPLWVRPESLITAMPPNIHQIIGHTPVEEITTKQVDDCKLILCDTGLSEYLIVDTTT